MRCCRRRAPQSKSLLLGAILALSIAFVNAFAAAPQGVDVHRPSITPVEDHMVLEAQFDIALTPTLEEVLNKGVPLYFLLEFELIRPRWYWFNERVVYIQQEYRLSYNALTRQYRLGVGNLHQNFGSMSEALEVMSRVRRRIEIDSGTLRRDTYIAALRFRLDTSQLPKPFQLNAIVAREWNVGSDWYRWAVTL
jgi:uncharacterized protein DUF4390